MDAKKIVKTAVFTIAAFLVGSIAAWFSLDLVGFGLMRWTMSPNAWDCFLGFTMFYITLPMLFLVMLACAAVVYALRSSAPACPCARVVAAVQACFASVIFVVVAINMNDLFSISKRLWWEGFWATCMSLWGFLFASLIVAVSWAGAVLGPVSMFIGMKKPEAPAAPAEPAAAEPAKA